jgi:hypothetical protein
MTETDLMNAVMLAATAKDCVIFRTNVGKVRMADGRWFDTGLPKGHADLYGVKRDGKVFYIETKLKPRKPTLEQCAFLLRMIDQGACAGVAYSVEEAMRIIRWYDVDQEFHISRLKKEFAKHGL